MNVNGHGLNMYTVRAILVVLIAVLLFSGLSLQIARVMLIDPVVEADPMDTLINSDCYRTSRRPMAECGQDNLKYDMEVEKLH